MKLFFFTICILTSSFIYAQNQATLLLKNAHVHLSENVSDYRVVDGEVYNGQVLRLLQFSGIPEEPLMRQIEKSGIRLLNYVPHNAYYASIPESLKADDLKKLGVLSAIIPTREFKLSPNLFHGTIPEHAIQEDGLIEIVLLPYKHIPIAALMRTIDLPNFTELRVVYQGNYAEAVCSIDEIEQLVHHPYVAHIFEAEAPPVKDNNTAITSHRVNTINGMDAISTGYTGAGITVSLGDDGAIGPHIDYQGRLDQSAADASSGDHGDHVAGTIFGAGNRDPRGRGMAPGAEILYYRYPQNLHNATTDYFTHDIRITSSSYSNGCNAGYTNFARLMDESSYLLPGLLHVFSAGNAGNDDCGYGAGSGWGNITGGHKAAKNVIAVGNVNRLDGIAASSSRGPAHDGRIKPEVVAVGTSVYSTTDPHLYTTKTGTSMACPGVAGSLAVLYEAYQDITSTPPTGGLMKAVLMNAADDLGRPGPDFIYGFGRINLRKSLRTIANEWIISSEVGHNNSNAHTIYTPPGVKKMKVMLYWTDIEAAAGVSKALVNDLDLTMHMGSMTYQPLVLNPTPNAFLLNQIATPGTDTLNNVEQITIPYPPSGTYTINVNGSLVPFGPQQYYIVYYFENEAPQLTYPIGGESLIPGTNEIIRWDALDVVDDFTLQYSSNNGASWQTITSGLPSQTRHYTWGVPHLASDEVKISLVSGAYSDESDSFTIIPVPENLKLESVCLDSTIIRWSSVDSAAAYVVYKLGNMYMDSIAYTTDNFYTFQGVNGLHEHWYSVSAVTAGGNVGRRAIAIPSTGLYNCLADSDLALIGVKAPNTGLIPACVADSLQMRLKVKNKGAQAINSFEVSRQTNNSPVITETFSLLLLPGDSAAINLSQYIIPEQGINNLNVWVTTANDLNPYNDSASLKFEIYGSSSEPLPIVMDFENDTLCPTTNNCEATICPLNSEFVNAENGVFDDIDWRVNSGTTPSQNTGPIYDNTVGDTTGKYIYLEATSCYNRKAELYTPCIDLSGTSTPVLEFYHHRRGNATGPLHIDIFSNGAWQPLMPPLTDETGLDWIRYEVSLLPFIGEKVALRFVGKTIGGWQGDIALDDISIIEYSQPPVAAFTASEKTTCLLSTVDLYDLSEGFPDSWQWDISPPHYNIVQGSLPSQNLSVVFTDPGLYSISLIAGNTNGNNIIQKIDIIEVLDTPFNPVAFNDTVNYGTQALLAASSANSNIFWYDSLNAPTFFHAGDTLITDVLFSTNTYYVEASTAKIDKNMPELLHYNFDIPGTTVVNNALYTVGDNPATIIGSGLSIGGEGLSGLGLKGSGANSATSIINTGWHTDLDGSFTIAFWTSDITPSSTLWYIWGDPGAGSLRCFTNGPAGSGNWLVRGGGLPELHVYGGAGTEPNMIHIVYDSDSATYSAYVDSVMVNSITAPQNNTISGTGFTIGGYTSNSGLSGLMDEFRIYNRALSETEIQASLNEMVIPCISDRLPVTAHVITPAVEIEVLDIIEPQNYSCLDSVQSPHVSILLTNNGTDDVTSNLSATYIVNNALPVTENITTSLASGDTMTFTFSTPINVNLSGGDTTLNITALVNHPDDSYNLNDTVQTVSSLTYKPGSPVVINDSIFLGGMAQLQAISPFNVNWYGSASISDNVVLGTGTTFTTPVLFGDTSFFAAAYEKTFYSNYLETTLNMGSGCGGGNMFNLTPVHEDLVITGFSIIPRNSNPNMPVNIYYKKETYSGFETNPGAWTQIGSYTINAIEDSLMYVKCKDFVLTHGQTYGIYIQYDARYTESQTIAAIADSSIVYEGGAGLCGSFTSVYSPRIFNGHIHYKTVPVVCESDRVEVKAVVGGTPPVDAGVLEIITPDTVSSAGTAETLEVVLKNFGSDTLFSIPVSYSINGTWVAQEIWTGILPPDSTTGYTFSSTISEISSYNLCVFTEVSGDVYYYNDTVCKHVNISSLDYDIAVLEIISPDNQTITGQEVDIRVRLKNFGTEVINELDLSFDIDGALPVIESWSGFLQPNQEYIYEFLSTYTSPSGDYELCVEAFLNNDFNPANNRICKTINGIVGIKDKSATVFALEQSSPNPSKVHTSIGFSIPNSGDIRFEVVNVLGQAVFEYSAYKKAGRHEIALSTEHLTQGIYYYMIDFEGQRLSKKLIVAK